MSTEKTEDQNEQYTDGEYVLTFSRPFTFEGETYETLVFEFEKINGRKLMQLADRLNVNDLQAPVKAMNMRFQAAVCAEAAGVPIQLIEELPGREFGKVTIMAQSFLLGMG